jgi:hypothetical protein
MKAARFIELYSKEIEAGTAAIFAGAGLSRSAGFVDWRGLLKGIADELGLDIDRETDLISVAQFHVNRHGGNRGHLNKAILEEFPVDKTPTEKHRLLSRLPISTWWTTNYDKLIERALETEERIPDIKYDIKQLAHSKPRRDVTLYKMHGDIDHPASAIITRDDYESYAHERGLFLDVLAGDLISKTFLFIGFSFTDPNFSQVLSRIRVRLRDNQRPHYAIFKGTDRKDFDCDEDFDYEKNKQSLLLEDLRRFNINPVIVDTYEEIDKIIEEIYRKFVSKYVFVSTSAADFSPWGESSVTKFMAKLGALITERGFRIVTGVGLGTGNAVMDGAIVAITSDAQKRLNEHILIRPFPHYAVAPEHREKAWHSYREDMIGRAGIAIFLFGNKETPDGIGPATGMIKEFEIARSRRVVVLPVGGTQSVSATLFNKVLEDEELQFGISPKALKILKSIADPVDDLDRLLEPVLSLLEEVRGNG